jgi:hypothetical protein
MDTEETIQLHLFWQPPRGRAPGNFWGFYCDHCETFFDLVSDGRIVLLSGGFTYYHALCESEARYIGYKE